jgi:hypothetical protein
VTLLCLLFGHRWRKFNAEQCPLPYAVCERCETARHRCNEIKWGAKQ